MHQVTSEGITKTYDKGKSFAVDKVTFEVDKGELFGLIGPDGAGKTSLFRILTTLLLPDEGKAAVNGYDVVTDYKKIRNVVGYMPGRFSLYPDLTVEENLNFFASVFGTTAQENYHLIKDMYSQIEPFKKRKAGNLSGGMKQKLALSCALVHRPNTLFLDEPTTGIDAVSRAELWEMLTKLKAEGITILVSTPYMDEANLCDRIALIQRGRILSIDTPSSVTRKYKGKLYAAKSQSMYRLLEEIRKYDQTQDCYAFGDSLHFTLKDDSGNGIESLSDFLTASTHFSFDLREIEPTIEDCFIGLLRE